MYLLREIWSDIRHGSPREWIALVGVIAGFYALMWACIYLFMAVM